MLLALPALIYDFSQSPITSKTEQKTDELVVKEDTLNLNA